AALDGGAAQPADRPQYGIARGARRPAEGGADRAWPGEGLRARGLQPTRRRDRARDPGDDRRRARTPADTGMTQRRLQGRRVVVGISGGIAAYKAIEVVRLLTEAGAEVQVMMTPEATRFVAPLTLEALSYHPVAADWLAPQGAGESHITLAEWADLIAIVPATANSLAKFALGLADAIEAVLQDRRNLEGLPVVVSAGGTREPVDPVRYVGNFSSGKMGRALAETAAARGADVTLVTTVPTNPEGINEVAVTSATEMLAARKTACSGADILVMAAAVADYAPDKVAAAKLQRTDQPMNLDLRPNVDVLTSLGPHRGLA